MNPNENKKSFGQRLRDGFRVLLDKEFWQKIGREIQSFFARFQKTIRVLRPNERRVIIILSIVILICVIILFRNYYLTKTSLNPEKGGVYIEGMAGSPKYLNPLFARSEIDRGISRILFLPLVEYSEKGELVPSLAKEFQILDSGIKYYFVLDDNITWHDGEKITSDDAEFTLLILQSEEYTGPYSQSFDGVGFEKIDDKSFSFILPEVNSSFASIITEIGILPKHKLSGIKMGLLDKNEFNLNPVGNGRYRIETKESGQNGSDVVLKKADTFKKDSDGYFDKIIFRSYSSAPAVIESYKKGEINGFGGFTLADISSIDRKTFRYYRLQIPRFTAVFLNMNQGTNKELKFRQALAGAINKEKIIDSVYSGDAVKLKSVIPPFAPGYNPEIADLPFDAKTSEAGLDELKYVDSDNNGVREKDGKDIELIVYTTDDQLMQKISEEIKADWEKIGIKTKVIVIDLLSLQKVVIPLGQYDAIILGENLDYPPDPYPYFHSSQISTGLNLSAYKNLAVDELLEDGRMTIDLEVRADKIRKFSKIISDDLPAIPILAAPYLYGTNISIKGVSKLSVAENSSDRFLDIGFWYIKSERKSK